jgi:polyisoprenoid-binding protein YceI
MDTATQRGLAPVTFQIDPSASRFVVQAFATGLLSVFGHNPRIAIADFDGQVEFIPETFEKAKAKVTVQTSRMEVLDEMKRDDRKKLEQEMYGKVLDVDDFPTAVFETTNVIVRKLDQDLLAAQVTGELSFHGVTKTETFDARAATMGSTMRVSGEFTLRQSDYGIKPLSFAGGALRLKDELKFTFELIARKRDGD